MYVMYFSVCNEAQKFYSTEHLGCDTIVVHITHCTIFNKNVQQDLYNVAMNIEYIFNRLLKQMGGVQDHNIRN